MADKPLSLDLVEEFRHPVIDGLVKTLVNTGSIKEDGSFGVWGGN